MFKAFPGPLDGLIIDGGMNPRAEGALEALSYLRQVVKRLEANGRVKDKLAYLEAEINELIELILSGVSVDFKRRLKTL